MPNNDDDDVIDVVLRWTLYDDQIWGVFQSLCLTGVMLWAVITLQTVWWETGGRS